MPIFHFLQADPIDTLPNLDLQGTVNYITHTPIETLLENSGAWFIHFFLRMVLCLVIFLLAKKGINLLSKLLRNWMDRRQADRTVSHFLINLLRVFFWLVILWLLVSILNVDTASIVALFASAGLAFGLALSGTLQNFAGGIMILIFKPFRTGDYISSQGEEGIVEEITIINTILITPDNRTIYLPNGATFTGIVRNNSQQDTRRVEWTFGIAYGDDYDKAHRLLIDMLRADSRILSTPEPPFVALKELGASSVNLVARAWVTTVNYWPVFFEINEKVYKAFPKEHLSIPFPQMDVYLHGTADDKK